MTKARTVITTDGEVDDMNSFIRFLLYANEVKYEGLVLTSSMYHYAGDKEKGIEPYRWTGTAWLGKLIDQYEKVYPNLCKHQDGYPTPDYLRATTKIGNVSYVGEMDETTEGSEFLKKLFLDDNMETLYVQTWGGTNTTAKALKDIEETYIHTDAWEEIQRKVYQKVVIYIILNQDDSYNDYIAVHWPHLRIINDVFNFWHFAYAWKFHDDRLNTYLKANWFKENVKFNHGPLLEQYALIGDGNYLEGELHEEQRGIDEYLEKNPQYERYDFISEGDSPSFFYLFDFGLRSMEDPSYGGWGGRFSKANDELYLNDALDYNPYTEQYEAEYSLIRWFDDIQLDFQERCDWCIADSFEKASHPPVVSVQEGLDIQVKANDVLKLHALAKSLDGKPLTYRWWRYSEADTYQLINHEPIITNKVSGLTFGKSQKGKEDTRVKLENENSEVLTVHIPEDIKKGETIHIILEVKGELSKRYQRVILHAI